LHLIKTQHYSSILFAAVVKVHTHKTCKRQRAEREKEEEAARAEEETCKRQRAEREREEEAARAEEGKQALEHQKAALERQVAQMQQQLEHHTLPLTLDPVLSHRSPN
jgi:hypothetical protein